MRWIDRRCVRQSSRSCVSCLCIFLPFPVVCVSAIHYSSQFSSAVIISSLVQHNTTVNTKVSVFGYHTILYFSILENTLCLYKFTFLKPSIMCPGFQQRDNLNYNLKKMKDACPIFKYYALLPDTCNYVKIKQFTMKEKYYSKIPPLEF